MTYPKEAALFEMKETRSSLNRYCSGIILEFADISPSDSLCYEFRSAFKPHEAPFFVFKDEVIPLTQTAKAIWDQLKAPSDV
jgi:hypothetical protein